MLQRSRASRKKKNSLACSLTDLKSGLLRLVDGKSEFIQMLKDIKKASDLSEVAKITPHLESLDQ